MLKLVIKMGKILQFVSFIMHYGLRRSKPTFFLVNKKIIHMMVPNKLSDFRLFAIVFQIVKPVPSSYPQPVGITVKIKAGYARCSFLRDGIVGKFALMEFTQQGF